MRKVKNKKAIINLSDKSFRASGSRNLIAVIAIVLTTVLFTALFTIGIGAVENFQTQTMRQAGGSSHGVFKDLTQEEYDKLKLHPLIKESADCRILANKVANEEFLKRHMEAWYIPAHHYEYNFIELKDGKVCESQDEILMDETSMKLLGLKPEAGQKVTLRLQVKASSQEIIERTFTISGVIKSDKALDVGFAIMSESYVNAYENELSYNGNDLADMTGAIRMDVNFRNSYNIQKKLDQVIEESGYSNNQEDANFVASNANWAYLSDGVSGDPITMGALIGGLVLIILTGYLIIYNIFQISVIKDIRYYGLLKTIGTTGKQIKRLIRRQAIWLGVIGIPIGLIAGFFVGKWFLPTIVNISSFEIEEITVSPDIKIFLAAAVFSFITVLISVGRPGRIAAKVSPIEAVRYTDAGHRKGIKRTTDGGKLWRMALSNLGRNKKRTVLVLLSLSLAIILLNCVFTITNSFDMDKYLKKFVLSDYMIANAKYFGQEGYWGVSPEYSSEESLTESFISVCENLNGFEEGGRIYGTMTNVGLKKESAKFPSRMAQNEEGVYGEYYEGNFIPFNTTKRGDYQTGFYGMEDFNIDKIEVWKGETNLEQIKQKLKTGKYLLNAVQTDDNNLVMESAVVHQPGDKVVLVGEDGREREFEILSVIKMNTYGMTNRSLSLFSYYTTADVFKEMASDKYLMSYAFSVQDDKEVAVGEYLKDYTETTEGMMHYESKITWLEEFSGLKNMFILVGTALSAVIGLIGILNFVNSIMTGMITRRKEFAMMQSIGMEKKQLCRMLILEGICYAFFTSLLSVILGCIVSLTLVGKLSGMMWFMSYHFMLAPILTAIPILLILGVAVPITTFSFHKKETVVESLRDSE